MSLSRDCVCPVNAVLKSVIRESFDLFIMSKREQGMKAHLIVMVMGCPLVTACVPFNQGLEGHLSKDPEVCKDGVKYLPYTHASDEAYTAEGRPETCPSDL